jgi:hypothetical protein
MKALGKLTVLISKTATGENDYLQILSQDQFSINIVLIGDEIVVNDRRLPEKPRGVK